MPEHPVCILTECIAALRCKFI